LAIGLLLDDRGLRSFAAIAKNMYAAVQKVKTFSALQHFPMPGQFTLGKSAV
jgi:hypothetical protein